MKKTIYPMTFTPVYKDYPWGGSRIPETFNRNLPPGTYAESWEIADHSDGMSIVANGIHRGIPLNEVLKNNAQDILGTRVQGSRFPLLIKLIDAKQKLSVQVHPNDQTAAEFGGEAKTEMWYMLGENDSAVYCGLKENVTRESFSRAVTNGTSGAQLKHFLLKQNDAVFVQGGCVHAIDAGSLILEIQQNSNTTYRVDDWGRVGNDGKPRELHIEQAMNVIDWNNTADPRCTPQSFGAIDLIQECAHFRLEKINLNGSIETPLDGSTFHALFIAEGELQLQWESDTMTATKGTSILIPAALRGYTLIGKAIILRTLLPYSSIH